MESLTTLRAFFGWCVVIHSIALVLSWAMIQFAHDPVVRIHQRMFRLSTEVLDESYFRFLAAYKIGVWLFAIGPYLALVAIG